MWRSSTAAVTPDRKGYPQSWSSAPDPVGLAPGFVLSAKRDTCVASLAGGFWLEAGRMGIRYGIAIVVRVPAVTVALYKQGCLCYG
jgi:hypothetical protein